ncbi:hypothetical protein K457DRAFT_16140 [Linnemannia elongata AG-77]|uniref:Uncharacterized protein n=1 Tax=Linnemannia elongata AG-77 TaxID=1314771 RepID=A0A197K4K0_9FUNG|nr:hypothetical protein K457DRAFT_16140 [Linnemannia elongata AG-77]
MPPTTTSGMSVFPSPSPSPSSSSSSITPSSSPNTTPPTWPTTFDTGYPTSVSQTSAPTATETSSLGGAFGPGGVPVATIFYFVAFVSGLVILIYTIHRVRRNRRRRLLEQNGSSDSDGRTRNTATYRPDDEEGCPPPQYRAYAADEPPLDPEMTIIYPDQAQYASSHLGLLSFSPALSSPSVDDNDSINAYMAPSHPTLQTDSAGPATSTTITTTITTTTSTPCTAPGSSTASPSASPTIIQRSIMAPNANILTTTPLSSTDRLDLHPQHQSQNQGHQQGGHMSSVPVISAPSPVFTFTASHLPILRNGLAGSNNIHQSGSGRSSSTPPTSSSTTGTGTGTGGTASTNNRLSTPDLQSTLRVPTPNRVIFAGPNSSTGSGNGGGSTSQSGLAVVEPQQQQHPILNRLRSQGPPPYIPVAPEVALPRLPPEYDTAIASSTVPATTTTTTATSGSW